jgi:hypothetical protein
MKVRFSVLAVLAALLVGVFGIAPAQAVTGPDLGSFVASPSTIYPLVNAGSHPGSTSLEMTGGFSSVTYLTIAPSNAPTTIVRTLQTGGADSVAWDGRNDSSAVVPAGTYTVTAFDSSNDPATINATVTVSGLKVIKKTFTKTVGASYGLIGKAVGHCSMLRHPDKRGTAGSAGYYGDTTCKNKSVKASLVSTVNQIRLPAANSYLDEQVLVTGGAAKAAKHSRAVVRYLTPTGRWVNQVLLTSKYTTHHGAVRSTAGMVTPDDYIGWGFYTGGSNKYDVAKFTIVVHYTVLG